MSKEVDQHILEIYDIKKLLGSGAYGHVWKVQEKVTQKQYALKKIFDAFHNDVDAQRTYRQITVLHELEHTNIIKLHKVLKAKNNKDLYLVFDFMEADLHSLVGEDILEEVHLKFVIYQILRALKYLHSAQLIHRDLKPSNILINSECQIKICDFGLVRSLAHEEDQPMILSEEVATRWYRSPQMLLGSKKYSKQTDVWSVGCIIAELLIGNPIFPGQSTLNQLQKILQFTGIPSKHSIDSLQSQNAEPLINQLTVHRKSCQDYFKNPPKDIAALALQMLEFNPKKRITIQDSLELPMFDEFKNFKNGQDVCTKFIVPQLDDNYRLNLTKYRQMIYRDIQRRYPPTQLEILSASNSAYERPFSFQRKKLTRSYHSFKRTKQKQQSINGKSDNLMKQVSKIGKNQHSSSFTHFKKSAGKLQKTKNCYLQYQKHLQNRLKHFQKSSIKNCQQQSQNTSTNISQSNNNQNKLIKVRSRKLMVMNKNQPKKKKMGEQIKYKNFR